MQHEERRERDLLGADRVIDYTKEDFLGRRERYDLIFAANGNRSLFEYRRALAPAGAYVVAGGTGKQMFQGMLLGPLLSRFSGGKRMGNMLERATREDLLFLKDLIEAGKLAPFIDRRYELKDVPEAVGYVEEGRAQRKVVIAVR